MGTLIEISQNLASHSLISNLRSSHTTIACKKLSNLAGKKKSLQVRCILVLLQVSIQVCPNHELQSHHVLSPTHITLGKLWQNPKLNCWQIFVEPCPLHHQKSSRNTTTSLWKQITSDISTNLLSYPLTQRKGSISASLIWRSLQGATAQDITKS